MAKTKKYEYDIQKEIQSIRDEIKNVENSFKYATDPFLINACIYELKALDSRYAYLRGEMRKNYNNVT